MSEKIDEIEEKLKDNPVFQMSLSSKELFHSNIIAWLLEEKVGDGSPSENAKALSKLFAPKDTDLNDYKVLTVLREKHNFDLLVVFKKNDSDDFRFVVVENKLKSLPRQDQLKEYSDKISKNINIKEDISNYIDLKDKKQKINETNTTCYLFAPKSSLEAKNWKNEKWNEVSYEAFIDTIQPYGSDFEKEFVKKYKEFVILMLNLGDTIKDYFSVPESKAFPEKNIIEKLKQIRIHDFYEKLWFSFLLSKLSELNKIISNLELNVQYSNGTGGLDFKYHKNNIVYMIEIQGSQFRIMVGPEKGYKWEGEENEYAPKIKGFLEKILGHKIDGNKELNKFNSYKYIYEKLDEGIKVSELREKLDEKLELLINEANKNVLQGVTQ